MDSTINEWPFVFLQNVIGLEVVIVYFGEFIIDISSLVGKKFSMHLIQNYFIPMPQPNAMQGQPPQKFPEYSFQRSLLHQEIQACRNAIPLLSHNQE